MQFRLRKGWETLLQSCSNKYLAVTKLFSGQNKATLRSVSPRDTEQRHNTNQKKVITIKTELTDNMKSKQVRTQDILGRDT